ncbi:glutathionylspermidine synthase family protein [Pseudomonas sp. Snoq117.2]|uniref:glutathionylspermidine synthase family protein n=1 Tax=Pseudomonas sp. Snoq117.2 TaxID=1500302 RepID=UPI0008B70DA4|nr:glutathionylspermidine synthase family protein [Pseudomonas sp. Snoq117.2]SEP34474.1 Glutathionylspermidine synthase [Pseudomonas sp. Snoq117.2]
MQRIAFSERPDWRQQAEALGFAFHTFDGEPYWDETAAYRFSLRQIEDDIEAPTAELHELCLALVDLIVEREELLERLQIPRFFWDHLRISWRRREPSLYGRMDLCYSGQGPAKLFELNYDTPTSLYEAAFFQWLWLEQQRERGVLPSTADQYNLIQERLIETLAELGVPQPLYLAAVRDSLEDRGTVDYLRDCATQAGLDARFLAMEDIGLERSGTFVDLQGHSIFSLFKLYPWEHLLEDPFGAAIPTSGTRFVEPPWKALLSNKGILALLWEQHPGHPNLLRTYFDARPSTHLAPGWVRKPLFSREGANVTLHTSDGRQVTVAGPYSGATIRQACQPLPCFDGHYPVLGSWVVGNRACGMGIREDRSLITQDSSRFLPHFILD